MSEDKENHLHLAWFGSELACSICNPACHQNHEMSNPNHLQWCGHPDCPMNPERFKKKEPSEEIKKQMAKYYEESAEEDLALAKEFESIEPTMCPQCNSINIGKDEDENHLCLDCGYHFDDDELWEEKEDKIRTSNQKSIRQQGKYKGRGKEKKREP